jgi:hypothetical protein
MKTECAGSVASVQGENCVSVTHGLLDEAFHISEYIAWAVNNEREDFGNIRSLNMRYFWT